MGNNASIPKIILLVAVLVLAGGFLYYGQKWYAEKRDTFRKEASKSYQKVYIETHIPGKDFNSIRKVVKDWEELFSKYAGGLSPHEEGEAKIVWSVALWIVNRGKAVALLKEVALNKSYPDRVRAHAVGGLVTNYELDFTDPDFAKSEIFKGEEFEKILVEAKGDESLAVRKLSEWSDSLNPNVISRYRIARWYAQQLYLKNFTDETQKAEFSRKADEYLLAGDDLMLQYYALIFPALRGYAYHLKARTLYLSEADPKEVEAAFENALKEYLLPPNNFYRKRYYTYTSFYYSAFLARTYGASRKEKVRELLRPVHEFLTSPGAEVGVLPINFLVAARDSQNDNYPYPEFNGKDLEKIKKIFPEFGKTVDGLKKLNYNGGL